jgi:hypothetical protein
VGPDIARNLDDNLDLAQEEQEEQEAQEKLSQTPRSFEEQKIKALSHEDRERFRSGKVGLEDLKKESEQVKDQATNLIEMARGQEKITKKEAKEYKKRLNISQRKGEREQIVEDLQGAIAQIQTTRDKNEELEKSDPELQRAYGQYDRLIKENAHLLGSKAVESNDPQESYTAWIRQQKPSIAEIEKLTVKFFQSQRPPRLAIYNKLKAKLPKYGIAKPTDIPFIEREGLSEREQFFERIESLESTMNKMGGLKDKLYSKKAERGIMQDLLHATTEQDQDTILNKVERTLHKEETNGYADLETAARSNRISQKSMTNILNYYKNLANTKDRLENLKLWPSFIENEAKLTDNLKEVFDKAPKNDEGYNLAFQAFKHMDFVGKEKFIADQKQKRETEINEEEHNKELVLLAFKQECEKARQENTLSDKTAENYEKWLDSRAKTATFAELKEFLAVLTSPTANEQHKNLKAYEKRKKLFRTDLRTLRDLDPTISDKKIAKWEKRYNEEGWTKRSNIHDELKIEINKAKENRIGEKAKKAGLKVIDGGKETKETTDTLSTDKKIAVQAINRLFDLEAYGDAMIMCWELLKHHKDDEEIKSLFDKIQKFANSGAKKANKAEQQDTYEKYQTLADKKMTNDTETKEDSDELQTKEQALHLTKKDQEQKKKTSAKDRNQDEVMEKVKHDTELGSYAEEYLEGSTDDEIIDADTLKATNVIKVDFDTEDTKQDKKTLRKQVRKEREKAGEYQGSTVIEFEQGKTGRTMDARSGKEAEAQLQKEKEVLAAEMALDIASIVHPEGAPTPDQLARAKEAALAKLNKKAKTKIERSTE